MVLKPLDVLGPQHGYGRRQTKNHFLRSLEKTPKVFLIGDNDDFREASRVRVVQAEGTSAKEIADLFSIVDRSTADSKVDKVSDDLRFQTAYNGVLTRLSPQGDGFAARVEAEQYEAFEQLCQNEVPLPPQQNSASGETQVDHSYIKHINPTKEYIGHDGFCL
jgi:hypothetical protein